MELSTASGCQRRAMSVETESIRSGSAAFSLMSWRDRELELVVDPNDRTPLRTPTLTPTSTSRSTMLPTTLAMVPPPPDAGAGAYPIGGAP